MFKHKEVKENNCFRNIGKIRGFYIVMKKVVGIKFVPAN
jgi:hypothetical protein